MNGLLERAAAFLLVPERTADSPAAATMPAEARAVVLGGPRDTEPLAAALALTLRAAERAPAALVAVWRPGSQDDRTTGGLASPSASRLASKLTRRELPTTARGRLAWLPLPDEPDAAAAALHSATAVVEGPAVTALAGPRPPALEPLIDAHDLAVVAAEPGTPLAEAALTALADRSVSAVACRPLPRGPSRAVALAGIAAPRLDPPLRAARVSEAQR
jgi:hypothetical protein